MCGSFYKLSNRLCSIFFILTFIASSPAFSSPLCAPPMGVRAGKGIVTSLVFDYNLAITILVNIYGKALTREQIPLQIIEKDGIYYVHGVRRPGSIGGTASLKMCKSNGAVLYLSHSK